MGFFRVSPCLPESLDPPDLFEIWSFEQVLGALRAAPKFHGYPVFLDFRTENLFKPD